MLKKSPLFGRPGTGHSQSARAFPAILLKIKDQKPKTILSNIQTNGYTPPFHIVSHIVKRCSYAIPGQVFFSIGNPRSADELYNFSLSYCAKSFIISAWMACFSAGFEILSRRFTSSSICCSMTSCFVSALRLFLTLYLSSIHRSYHQPFPIADFRLPMKTLTSRPACRKLFLQGSIFILNTATSSGILFQPGEKHGT